MIAVLIFLRGAFSVGAADVAQRYYELSLVPSPGNVEHPLKVCTGQRIADAVADYLLSLGIHDDQFVPEQVEFEGIVAHLCFHKLAEQLNGRNLCENVGSPSLFRSESNKFSTVYFGDSAETSTSARIFLRDGYTADQLSACVCEKHVCEVSVQAAIAEYLQGILSAL